MRQDPDEASDFDLSTDGVETGGFGETFRDVEIEEVEEGFAPVFGGWGGHFGWVFFWCFGAVRLGRVVLFGKIGLGFVVQ